MFAGRSILHIVRVALVALAVCLVAGRAIAATALCCDDAQCATSDGDEHDNGGEPCGPDCLACHCGHSGPSALYPPIAPNLEWPALLVDSTTDLRTHDMRGLNAANDVFHPPRA